MNQLTDAIAAELEVIAANNDVEDGGTLTRYVIVTETLHSGYGRRVSYIARSFDGTGMYPWETMGMIEYFMRQYTKELDED